MASPSLSLPILGIFLECKLYLQGENFLFGHSGTVVARSTCGSAEVVPTSPGSADEVQEGLNADRGLTQQPTLDSQRPISGHGDFL